MMLFQQTICRLKIKIKLKMHIDLKKIDELSLTHEQFDFCN